MCLKKRKHGLDGPQPLHSAQLSSVSKTKKLTGRAAGSLVLSDRCVIFSFIDYIDNGVEPSCQTIRRKYCFGL